MTPRDVIVGVLSIVWPGAGYPPGSLGFTSRADEINRAADALLAAGVTAPESPRCGKQFSIEGLMPGVTLRCTLSPGHQELCGFRAQPRNRT